MFGQPFVVEIDQQSLKFLLEQKVETPQQKWVFKLLGYDFIIEYKKGKENKMADALSRRFEKLERDSLCMLISGPDPTWLEELKASYSIDPKIQSIM